MTNTWMLREVARRLGAVCEEVVFVGGAVVEMLVDEASVGIRPTFDVDLVFEATTAADYYALSDRLRMLGFRECAEGPSCRWTVGDIVVDVMPASGVVVGHTNQWYPSAITHSQYVDVGDGLRVKIIDAPHFLATKLEAFAHRGGGDYVSSRDMEDVVAVIDGRPSIAAEIEGAPSGVALWLRERMRTLAAEDRFVEAIPAHLPSDEVSQERGPIVLERVRRIAGLT